MNGVMTDGVSAGSNQVGASEMCTAHVSSPSGAATAGAAARRRTRASVTECLRIYRRAIRRRKTAPY